MKNKQFLKDYAATGRFTYGAPRSLYITKDSNYILFLRAKSSKSSKLHLYELDLTTNKEKLLIDSDSAVRSELNLSKEQLQLRERMREIAGGITTYSIDSSSQKIVCS